MYYKIPVLTTNVGAAQEMIDHNTNGWIINVDADQELFETIKKIVKLEKDTRTAIGQKAHEVVVNRYSIGPHIDALFHLYKSKS